MAYNSVHLLLFRVPYDLVIHQWNMIYDDHSNDGT